MQTKTKTKNKNKKKSKFKNKFLLLVLVLVLPSVVLANGKKTEFSKCGEVFFPRLVADIDDLDFAWVYGTDFLTSKNKDRPQESIVYTSAGSLKLGKESGSCSSDSGQTREHIVAGWIKEAKSHLRSDEFNSVVKACQNVKNSEIHEALGLGETRNSGEKIRDSLNLKEN